MQRVRVEIDHQSAQARYCALVAAIGQRNLPPGGEATMTPILAEIPAKARRIIDLGCNTGWVARQIARAFPTSEVIGIDVDGAMIRAARAAACAEGSPARFEEVDGAAMQRYAGSADAIVCGGSAAFFSHPADVYRTAASCLCEDGKLIDCHYLYDAHFPAGLRQEGIRLFGLAWMPDGLSEIARTYADAGLVIHRAARFPRFRFERNALSELYRDIMRNDPSLRPLVDQMAERRDFIDRLSDFRFPYMIVAGTTGPKNRRRRRGGDLVKLAAVLDLFNEPVPAQPIEVLRTMRPYEFLAYVGDPDAAPGGGRAVARLAQLLRDLGVPKDGKVLDVGCFTGLSTIMLGMKFTDVLGIDIESRFLEVARAVVARMGVSVSLQSGDGGATGFADCAFDAVVMTATLAYTPRPMDLLRESARILKPAGLLAEFVYHHVETSPASLRRMRAAVGPDIFLSPLSAKLTQFEQAGFQLVRLDLVETSSAPRADQEWLNTYVTARESARDPSKTYDALHAFSELFSAYTGRMSGSSRPPLAYRCIFEKPTG